MSLPVERELSNEDYSLIEVHQLGTPVSIYRLRSVYFHTLRGGSFFSLGLGTGLFIFLLWISVVRWPAEQANEDPGIFVIGFLFLACLSVFLLFAGIFVLRVEIPRTQKKRIIACEQGLLFIGMGVRNKDVEVVRWSDILALRKFKNPFGKYLITYRGNKVIALDIMYQNLEELGALIETRKEKVSNLQDPGH